MSESTTTTRRQFDLVTAIGIETREAEIRVRQRFGVAVAGHVAGLRQELHEYKKLREAQRAAIVEAAADEATR